VQVDRAVLGGVGADQHGARGGRFCPPACRGWLLRGLRLRHRVRPEHGLLREGCFSLWECMPELGTVHRDRRLDLALRRELHHHDRPRAERVLSWPGGSGRGCITSDGVGSDAPTGSEKARRALNAVPWTCSECSISRETAESRRASQGKQPLKADAVTCGAPDCQRARERGLLRERYGAGTGYAAAHRRRWSRGGQQ
jgi:hypothetical protein